MKKFVLATALTVAAGGTLLFQSCDKVVNEVFKAFLSQEYETEVLIPASPAGQTTANGEVTQELNIDSVIRDHTKGAFGIDDVGRISIKSVAIDLANADDQNNVANFEKLSVGIKSDGGAPSIMAEAEIPDTYASSYTFADDDLERGVDLRQYMRGTQVQYTYSTQLRRETTKELKAKLKVKFSIEE